MGTSYTPSVLRGILVPDPRYVYGEGAITATSEAGPRVGVPEPQGETEAVLEATGAQTVDREVQTQRAGHPGQGATILHKPEADDADEWRGWDPPAMPTGWECIDNTTTTDNWRTPHVVALADGTICQAVTKSLRYVTCWKRNPTTGAWTEHEVYDKGTVYSTFEPHPTFIPLPSGRLLCVFWTELGTDAQLRVHYSDDSGDTWATAQLGSLAEAIDSAAFMPGRLRGTYHAGQLSLFGHLVKQAGPEDHLRQWASNDLGATFDEVDNLTAVDRAFPDVVTHEGGIVVAYVSATASTGATYPPYVRLLGSAYEKVSDAEFYLAQLDTDPMEWASQSGGVYDDGELALWSDEDGRLWIVGRDLGAGDNDVLTRQSTDGGRTWRDPGNGPATAFGTLVWRGRDADTYPRALSCCAYRGRAFLAHQCAANPGTRDPSLFGLWLGGYTTVCMPQEVAVTPDVVEITGFTTTWMPYDFPDDTGNTVPVWTRATGTGSRTLGADGMRLQTGSGQAELYSCVVVPGTIAEGIGAVFECRCDSGTTYLDLRLSDATPLQYTIRINVTPTEIRVLDGATTLGVVATTAADGGKVQILVHQYNTFALVMWREVTADVDRKWEQICRAVAVSSTATHTSHRVLFGQGDSTVSYWTFVGFNSDQYVGQGFYAQTNPDDLLGRELMPTPVYLADGLSVHAIDGPTFRGDLWDIDVQHEYPVENIMPDVAATPRRPFRSATDSTYCDIEIVLGDSITHLMGSLLGIMFVDGNFPEAEVYGMDAGGAYSLIGTCDRRAQTGLYWGRSGRIIRGQAGGASVPWYCHAHDLAGSYYSFDDGGEDRKTRRIQTNSPGRYNGDITASLQTRILLEEIDGTEATSGTNGEIWMKNSAHVMPITARYRRLKIRLLDCDTWEGYHRLGSMLIGHVHPIGAFLQEPGWGGVREWAPDFESIEGRTGVRDIHKLGPTRRAAEISWVFGVNTLQVQTLNDPDWILGWSGGHAVAVPSDVPWTIPGTMERLDGAVTPVGYLSSFDAPATSSTVVDITDPTLHLYGRIMSETLRVDNVNGTPETGEIVRVGTVRMEGEV